MEASERLANAARAALDNISEVTAQRVEVNRLINTTRATISNLNTRIVEIAADLKQFKEAQTFTSFAREEPNDSELLDMPAFLPSPGRSVN